MEGKNLKFSLPFHFFPQVPITPNVTQFQVDVTTCAQLVIQSFPLTMLTSQEIHNIAATIKWDRET